MKTISEEQKLQLTVKDEFHEMLFIILEKQKEKDVESLFNNMDFLLDKDLCETVREVIYDVYRYQNQTNID